MKWFTLSLLLPCCLLAAPKNGGAEEMARLRMILHNLEQEVSVLQEKLETEESVLETVQDQLANRSNHEQINKLEASQQ
ncbi:MAG: hypothetical protein KDK65_00230, partial [Chlamydiia bacterium]|nr:hypothetical protein [Chlamydiia bacterium]